MAKKDMEMPEVFNDGKKYYCLQCKGKRTEIKFMKNSNCPGCGEIIHWTKPMMTTAEYYEKHPGERVRPQKRTGEFNMDIGDKVKLVKGNPFGKVGIIKSYVMMSKPVLLGYGKDMGKLEKHFLAVAEDGTEFSGFEDQFELVKK